MKLRQLVLHCHSQRNLGIFSLHFGGPKLYFFSPLLSLHFYGTHYVHSVDNPGFCQSGENCFLGREGGLWKHRCLSAKSVQTNSSLVYKNYGYDRMVNLQDLLTMNEVLGIQNNLCIPYWRRCNLHLTGTELKSKRVNTSLYQVPKEWRAGTVRSTRFEVNVLWSSLLLEKPVHFKRHCPSDGALEFDCRILWKGVVRDVINMTNKGKTQV